MSLMKLIGKRRLSDYLDLIESSWEETDKQANIALQSFCKLKKGSDVAWQTNSSQPPVITPAPSAPT